MKPLLIIKLEIVVQATPSRVNGVISVKIDILILHGAPETLNEDVIKIATSAVPTDGNVRCLALQS